MGSFYILPWDNTKKHLLCKLFRIVSMTYFSEANERSKRVIIYLFLGGFRLISTNCAGISIAVHLGDNPLLNLDWCTKIIGSDAPRVEAKRGQKLSEVWSAVITNKVLLTNFVAACFKKTLMPIWVIWTTLCIGSRFLNCIFHYCLAWYMGVESW